jgi:hypothetical protein
LGAKSKLGKISVLHRSVIERVIGLDVGRTITIARVIPRLQAKVLDDIGHGSEHSESADHRE